MQTAARMKAVTSGLGLAARHSKLQRSRMQQSRLGVRRCRRCGAVQQVGLGLGLGVQCEVMRAEPVQSRGAWATKGWQGSRVNSPVSGTLQASALPYTSGSSLGHAAATCWFLARWGSVEGSREEGPGGDGRGWA